MEDLFGYQVILHNVTEIIAFIKAKKQNVAAVSDKHLSRHYQVSQIRYGAEILPIQQSVDSRSSRGMCAGYVIEWAERLLKRQAPFGIRIDAPFPFPVVPSDLLVLNHVIPMSWTIKHKQKWQTLTKNLAQGAGIQDVSRVFPGSSKLANRLLIKFII